MYPYKIYPYESVCANYTLYQPVNCVIFMDYLAASILDIYWKYTPTQTDGYLAPILPSSVPVANLSISKAELRLAPLLLYFTVNF